MKSHAGVDFKRECYLLSCFKLSLHLNYSVVGERHDVVALLGLLHELGQLSKKHNIIDMGGFEAICHKVDIKCLDFLDDLGLLLVSILNIDVSDAVHEVVNNLALEVQLSFKTILEDVGRDEAILLRIQALELLAEPTDDLDVIKLISILEEWRWKAKEWRVVHVFNRLELQAASNELDKLSLKRFISHHVLDHGDNLFDFSVAVALLVKLLDNLFLNVVTMIVEDGVHVVDVEIGVLMRVEEVKAHGKTIT